MTFQALSEAESPVIVEDIAQKTSAECQLIRMMVVLPLDQMVAKLRTSRILRYITAIAAVAEVSFMEEVVEGGFGHE